jgi:glycosyltransferase involved in cell wall biosynthesis
MGRLTVTASVVIATRDRADRLRQALDSLERMAVPDAVSWEVILVDNGSTDATPIVVAECLARGLLPIRYLVDQRAGKSIALNAGIRAAKGDIVVFTDDDCVVAADWLATLVAEFARDDSIAALGGRVELYDPSDLPYTIRTRTTRDEFAPSKLLHLIVGCNMAFRRQALERVGEFDETLGPGSKCRAAEDFDLLYRAYKRGQRIVYVPDVLVYHNHGRRTEADVRRLYRSYGISMGAFYGKYILQRDCAVTGLAWRHARSILSDTWRQLLAESATRRPNQIKMRDLVSGATMQLSARLR